MAESSRKLKTKTVLKKYKILKEIEKGEMCASIVKKNLDKWDFLRGGLRLTGTPAKWDRF